MPDDSLIITIDDVEDLFKKRVTVKDHLLNILRQPLETPYAIEISSPLEEYRIDSNIRVTLSRMKSQAISRGLKVKEFKLLKELKEVTNEDGTSKILLVYTRSVNEKVKIQSQLEKEFTSLLIKDENKEEWEEI